MWHWWQNLSSFHGVYSAVTPWRKAVQYEPRNVGKFSRNGVSGGFREGAARAPSPRKKKKKKKKSLWSTSVFFKNSIPCCTRMPSASASESFPLRALGHGHRGLRACDACARTKPFAPPKSKSWIRAWELHVVTSWQFRSYRVYVAITGSRCGCYEVYVAHNWHVAMYTRLQQRISL